MPKAMQNSLRATAPGVNAIGMLQHSYNPAQLDRITASIARRVATPIAIALTKTAKDIERAETDELAGKIDKPAPFTLRAYGTDPATRSKLQARVFMRPLQSRYLRYQIDGGPRVRKAFELRLGGRILQALAVPGGDIQLDQFGNVSRSDIIALTRELNRPDAGKRYFVGVPKNMPGMPAGVYRRRPDGSGVDLLLLIVDGATYQPLIRWLAVARETFARRWPINIAQALASTR